MRRTLNGEFYDSAFNEEEKAFIQLSDNITEVGTFGARPAIWIAK